MMVWWFDDAMINWYDNNVMMSIWHKMYVNSLRTVQSAYSRLFDDNDSKLWWYDWVIWYDLMINTKNITFIIDDLSTGPPICPPSTPVSPSLPLSSSSSRWAEHLTSSFLLLWLSSSSTFQRCSRRQAADRREQTRCHSQTNYDLNCEETRQLDQLWKKPDNRVMWRSWSPPAGSVLKLICVQVPF